MKLSILVSEDSCFLVCVPVCQLVTISWVFSWTWIRSSNYGVNISWTLLPAPVSVLLVLLLCITENKWKSNVPVENTYDYRWQLGWFQISINL